MLKVSAIISTYNAANLIRGCLEDLLNQTLYKKGKLEIIIIDSGSLQNEAEIVRKYQDKHSQIKYLRTESRETLYQSWNRGISIAKGEFITNANTDDRHDRKCLEILAQELEEKCGIDLVYGNLFKSLKPNEEFVENDKSMPCESQKFSPGTLLLHNFIGAQPMWRKSLHEKIGLFDEKFEVVGDYEFFLRAASEGCKFSYVNDAEGLMLRHANALSTRDSTSHYEKLSLLKFFRSSEQIKRIYRPYFENSSMWQNASNDLGIRSLCYYPQFSKGYPQFDFSFAKECFSHNSDQISQYNLNSLNKIVQPQSKLETNCFQSLFFYSYSEKLPPEYELKGTDPIYFRLLGDEIIKGVVHQKYKFDLIKFNEFFFGHLDLKVISKANSIFIWGYNERARFLEIYLENLGHKNIRFIDSNPEIHNEFSQTNLKKPIPPERLKDVENSLFILTMSSHHWPIVTTQINNIFSDSIILTFDKT